jgi:hypothetical protein
MRDISRVLDEIMKKNKTPQRIADALLRAYKAQLRRRRRR